MSENDSDGTGNGDTSASTFDADQHRLWLELYHEREQLIQTDDAWPEAEFEQKLREVDTLDKAQLNALLNTMRKFIVAADADLAENFPIRTEVGYSIVQLIHLGGIPDELRSGILEMNGTKRAREQRMAVASKILERLDRLEGHVAPLQRYDEEQIWATIHSNNIPELRVLLDTLETDAFKAKHGITKLSGMFKRGITRALNSAYLLSYDNKGVDQVEMYDETCTAIEERERLARIIRTHLDELLEKKARKLKVA